MTKIKDGLLGFIRGLGVQLVKQLKVKRGRVMILGIVAIGIFYGMLNHVTLALVTGTICGYLYNELEEWIKEG
jgi:hypothetical protein